MLDFDQALAADPHGAAMLDYLACRYDGSFYYVRDDDRPSPFDIAERFTDYAEFSATEKSACALARGRVLDVGCGSGKHVLAMRELGYECLGIDSSSVVAEVWRRRGLEGVHRMDAFNLAVGSDSFDSVTLFANGLSIGGTVAGTRRLLAEFDRITPMSGRVVVTNIDPKKSPHEYDHMYHRANEAAGRLPGELWLRVRYRNVDSTPFPWLLISPGDLTLVLDGTGWRMSGVHQQPNGEYCAVLEKSA